MKWIQYITNDIEVIHGKIAVFHSTRQNKTKNEYSLLKMFLTPPSSSSTSSFI
jgi:hypothetical protein